jgi:hypothetical protein
MFGQQITPDLLRLIPDLVRLNHQREQASFDNAQTEAEHNVEVHKAAHSHFHDEVDKALQIANLQVQAHQAQSARITAEQTPQSAGVSSSPTQSGQGN